MDASSLQSVEAKAFVPARDFELAKRFYRAVGFTLVWSTEQLAYFRHGGSCFLLQNFYVKEHAENFKMHLWVRDVDAWWRQVSAAAAEFGITVEPPADRAWGMRDFPLVDPSGVLWRIGQPVPAPAPAPAPAVAVVVEHVPEPTQETRDLLGELDAELAAEYVAENRHGLSVDRIFRDGVRFFVARLDGEAVGCGGVSLDDGAFAEVRRMYVRPAARGRGVGRAILARLEAEARARGGTRLVLETGDAQLAAIRLYEQAGFSRRGAFGKYAALPSTGVARCVFFEKTIG